MERELNEYFREITQGCYSKIEGRLQKYGIVKAQAQLLLLIKKWKTIHLLKKLWKVAQKKKMQESIGQ